MRVRFHPLAQREMLQAARYYEDRREGLGGAFLDEIGIVVARIKASPSAIRLFNADLRSRLLTRFPYAIIYRMHEGDAFVVAVAHHARRPGYWRKRSTGPRP